MNIPEEAIEAAAADMWDQNPEQTNMDGAGIPWANALDYFKRRYRAYARTALEAAAPHVAAQALRETADRAFKSKQLHGLQRVLIGNYLRECAAELEPTA